MSCDQHTLTMVQQGAGRFVITMASGPERVLETAVRAAINEIQDHPERFPPQARDTRDVLGFLVNLLNLTESRDIRAAHEQAGRPQPFEDWAQDYFSRLVDGPLRLLAGKGLHSIDAFFAHVPATRYLPEEFLGNTWIRTTLYAPGRLWSAKRSAAPVRAEVARVAGVIDAANQAAAAGNATAAATFWRSIQIAPDGQPGYKIAASARLGVYTAATYRLEVQTAAEAFPLDHIVSLASHWVAGGNNLLDADRQTQVGLNEKNLEIVSRDWNSRKDSRGARFTDRPFVTADFESTEAASPKMSVRIGGRYFLRSRNGQPVV
jgi:hypothetical protein